MLGVDSDSAFKGQSALRYCKGHGLVQTRSRAYKKNDPAWVEQKNGAVVRRLVGFAPLSGVVATKALAPLQVLLAAFSLDLFPRAVLWLPGLM